MHLEFGFGLWWENVWVCVCLWDFCWKFVVVNENKKKWRRISHGSTQCSLLIQCIYHHSAPAPFHRSLRFFRSFDSFFLYLFFVAVALSLSLCLFLLSFYFYLASLYLSILLSSSIFFPSMSRSFFLPISVSISIPTQCRSHCLKSDYGKQCQLPSNCKAKSVINEIATKKKCWIFVQMLLLHQVAPQAAPSSKT